MGGGAVRISYIGTAVCCGIEETGEFGNSTKVNSYKEVGLENFPFGMLSFNINKPRGERKGWGNGS